jgi:hypothetical protein
MPTQRRATRHPRPRPAGLGTCSPTRQTACATTSPPPTSCPPPTPVAEPRTKRRGPGAGPSGPTVPGIRSRGRHPAGQRPDPAVARLRCCRTGLPASRKSSWATTRRPNTSWDEPPSRGCTISRWVPLTTSRRAKLPHWTGGARPSPSACRPPVEQVAAGSRRSWPRSLTRAMLRR